MTESVCRWADKCCLHCNIFIYIRHIWIKPVLCSLMVSVFHHTSPWTRRCLQFSPSAHRNGRVFRRSVPTACCYWILNCGKSYSNWNSQTNATRLWWSVCWCECSKMLCKAVQRWRIGAGRFEWQNMKWKACDRIQKLVQLFYFIKISFPIHFLFKWMQNLPFNIKLTSLPSYMWTMIKWT